MRYVSLLLIFLLVVPVFAQNKHADDVIYDEVRRKLANDVIVKGGGLDVNVKDGEVTLQGRVHDEKARAQAEKIVKKIKGVTAVNNQLKIFGKD